MPIFDPCLKAFEFFFYSYAHKLPPSEVLKNRIPTRLIIRLWINAEDDFLGNSYCKRTGEGPRVDYYSKNNHREKGNYIEKRAGLGLTEKLSSIHK